jgi:hypothetical protein
MNKETWYFVCKHWHEYELSYDEPQDRNKFIRCFKCECSGIATLLVYAEKIKPDKVEIKEMMDAASKIRGV